jgi:hypothetical protein
VRKLYGTKTQTHSSPKLHHDNSDIECEQYLTDKEQLEILNKRLDSIHESLDIFEKYVFILVSKINYIFINNCCSLATSCECNFRHKLLLIKAECARVSLILGSTAIFNRRVDGKLQEGKKQDFEEAMELYENAIQSAHSNGFAQYEVVGLELYALFWLTATSHTKEHVASG